MVSGLCCIIVDVGRRKSEGDDSVQWGLVLQLLLLNEEDLAPVRYLALGVQLRELLEVFLLLIVLQILATEGQHALHMTLVVHRQVQSSAQNNRE